MTNMTEKAMDLSDEYKEFARKLDQFRAETQLSTSSVAKVLDVTPGTMSKWFRIDPDTKKIRLPQGYVKDAVELKIDRLNAANEQRGVYSALRGLKPNERISLLQSVLDGQHS